MTHLLPSKCAKGAFQAFYLWKPDMTSLSFVGNEDSIVDPPAVLLGKKYVSFVCGDEVFVLYSHKNDHPKLIGVVVSIRNDTYHAGKLIRVRFMDGTVDEFSPKSLAHVFITHPEKRQNETFKYNTVAQEYKQHFYDKFKAAYMLSNGNPDLLSLTNLSLTMTVPTTYFTPTFPNFKSKSTDGIYTPAEWFDGVFATKIATPFAASSMFETTDVVVGVSLINEKAAKIQGGDVDKNEEVTSHGVVSPVPEKGTKYPTAPKLPSLVEDTVEEILGKPNSEIIHGTDAVIELVNDKTQDVLEEDEAETVTVDITKFHFECIANAAFVGFGGTHSKYVLRDSNGKKYLYKPYQEKEQYRAWADIIAYKVAKKVGLPTATLGLEPLTFYVPKGFGGSYHGKLSVGSIQEIIDTKHNSIEHLFTSAKSFTKSIIKRMQQEHVLDWLIGNNDAHKNQFIIDKEDNIIGVDKGHAFKYYKDDVLSIGYDPANNKTLGNEQVYNLLVKAAKKSKLVLEWPIVDSFITHVQETLKPEEFAEYVYPYAKFSVKWAKNPSELQQLAVDRLKNLRKDFYLFYKKNELIPVSNHVEYEEEVIPESYCYEKDAFRNIDENVLQEIMNSGALGHSIPMGGGDIEDMNVLFKSYTWSEGTYKGKKGLIGTFKLMNGSEKNVITYFDTVQDQDTKTIEKNGFLETSFDPLASIVIESAKTVNHHCETDGGSPDGKFNPITMNSFATWFQGLDEFNKDKPLLSTQKIAMNLCKKHITDTFFENPLTLANELAEYYHGIAEEIMAAIHSKSKTKNKSISPWSGTYTYKDVSVSNKSYPYAKFPVLKINSDGKLIRITGEKYTIHGNTPYKFGCMFRKELDEDITVTYYPHYSQSLYGQNNLRSQQGKFVVDFKNWDGGIESLHKFRNILKEIGIDHKLATHLDLEILYLTRIAWHNKADVYHSGIYNSISMMSNTEEKLKELKTLCAVSYGKPVEETMHYMPFPRWDEGKGSHYFLNPYVLDHLAYETDDYIPVLCHSISHGNIKDESMEHIMLNGLLSTEQRVEMDLLYYGQSSEKDQKTGGANYVFLSLKKIDKNLGDLSGVDSLLVFRPELLARTDCFGNIKDNFGSTHNTESSPEGLKSISDRVKIMDILNKSTTGNDTKFSMYEVLFKDRVAMSEWFTAVTKSKFENNSSNKKWLAILEKWVETKFINIEEYMY